MATQSITFRIPSFQAARSRRQLPHKPCHCVSTQVRAALGCPAGPSSVVAEMYFLQSVERHSLLPGPYPPRQLLKPRIVTHEVKCWMDLQADQLVGMLHVSFLQPENYSVLIF